MYRKKRLKRFKKSSYFYISLGGAMALLKRVSEDDRLRYEQESRDKFLFDQHWDRIYKFEEGMEKGIEKGLRKGIEKE